MVGLSVAVVCFGAVVAPSAPRAEADPVAAAQAQQAQLQAQVIDSANRIRSLTVAYEQAETQASALASQVAADQARIGQLESQVSSTRRALRIDAVLSYTGASSTTPGGLEVPGGDPAVRAEYLEVAVGDVADTVDRYRAQESQIASAEHQLTSEIAASQAAARATDATRQQALAVAQSVQSQLAQVQTRITQLVAERAAAQTAAAAAAQTAAAQAAARATQGLPVGGGLVSVVRNVVTPAPAATPAAAPAASGDGGAGGVWLQLRECESGDNYRADTGNGFYGAYQFSASTWTGLGYPGRPDLEPPAMQDQAAQRLQAESGWGQWPACAAALGLT